LRDTSISRRFDLDGRRYSRYGEIGSFTSASNTGGHLEEGTVFVPGSHTPRAAYANLTVHMFGHRYLCRQPDLRPYDYSVNFFEIGARAEGLDNLLENLFGSDGMFSGKNFGDKKDAVIEDDGFSAQAEKVRRGIVGHLDGTNKL
jgi:hypothetical protein